MGNRLLIWADWFWKKVGYPTSADVSRYCDDWDRGQARATPYVKGVAREQEIEALRLFKADPESAFPDLLANAESGSVASMERIAWCYDAGKGVSRDPIEAELWYRRAFLCGSDYGVLRYGWVLWGRRNYADAEAVFRVGAERDLAPALEWLAYCRLKQSKNRKTLREARLLLERAAAQGSPRAKDRLVRLRGVSGFLEIPGSWRLVREFTDYIFDRYRANANSRSKVRLSLNRQPPTRFFTSASTADGPAGVHLLALAQTLWLEEIVRPPPNQPG